MTFQARLIDGPANGKLVELDFETPPPYVYVADFPKVPVLPCRETTEMYATKLRYVRTSVNDLAYNQNYKFDGR